MTHLGRLLCLIPIGCVLWLTLVFLALHGYIPFEAFGMFSEAGNNFYNAWSLDTLVTYWKG